LCDLARGGAKWQYKNSSANIKCVAQSLAGVNMSADCMLAVPVPRTAARLHTILVASLLQQQLCIIKTVHGMYKAPMLAHSYKAPMLAHSYKAPMLAHSYKVLMLAHSYKAPMLAHSYKALMLAHSYKAPMLAHSYKVLMLAHSYKAHMLAHSYKVPMPARTLIVCYYTCDQDSNFMQFRDFVSRTRWKERRKEDIEG
jgi:hypothetical protein